MISQFNMKSRTMAENDAPAELCEIASPEATFYPTRHTHERLPGQRCVRFAVALGMAELPGCFPNASSFGILPEMSHLRSSSSVEAITASTERKNAWRSCTTCTHQLTTESTSCRPLRARETCVYQQRRKSADGDLLTSHLQAFSLATESSYHTAS